MSLVQYMIVFTSFLAFTTEIYGKKYSPPFVLAHKIFIFRAKSMYDPFEYERCMRSSGPVSLHGSGFSVKPGRTYEKLFKEICV